MSLKKQKIPKELKDLASFLTRRGYTLALPFNDIRKPGYIGTFNAKGQEIIVDQGKCLEGLVTPLSGNAMLGSYLKTSKFTLKGFLNMFGNIFSLNFGALKVKNVSISFPDSIVKSDYITVMDIEEDWGSITPACVKKMADPSHFVIVQTLETSSMDYIYDTKTDLNATIKADLEKTVEDAVKAGKFEAEVTYNSTRKFTITVTDVPLTIGYKAINFVPSTI